MVRVLAVVLAVPLIAFGVGEGLQARFDSQLRSAARQQMPDADPAAIARLTLDSICEDPDKDFREICAEHANLNTLSAGAVAAGGAGLILLVAIAAAGLVTRRSRILLLLLFKPGLYLTALTLTCLVVAHATLAMTALYYGESALFGRIHIGIIAAIGIGAIAGVLAIARNVFAVVKKAQTIAIGKPMTRQEAAELWSEVEGIANRLQALRPDHIVVGLDPNFFVTEADVITLNGTLTGRTLYCSLPLARIMTRDEFRAVVGHELGHFKGSDTRFSERFYPIYRGTANSIAALYAAGGEGSGAIALLPALGIMGYFLDRFSVAESKLSRMREFAADEAGATVVNANTMATALVKVHAFCGIWDEVQQAAAEALKEGKLFINASKTYADAVVDRAAPTAFEGIADTHLSHPTDSHPPLAARLTSLGLDIAAVADAALTVTPKNPAVSLMPDHEHNEQEISEAYQVLLAHQLGIDLTEQELQTAADSSPVARCMHCGSKVVPTGEGRCPSCGNAIESPAAVAT